MKNIEKYEKELRKYGTYFAITEKGVVVDDDLCECEECLFKGGNCYHKRMEWLLEEYKEHPKPLLTDEEKIIIKNILKAFEPFGAEVQCIARVMSQRIII